MDSPMAEHCQRDSAAAGDEDDYSGDHPLAAEEWLASRILDCFANARALCRFALVNRNFCAASVSDLVWQKVLPPAALLDALPTDFDYKLHSKKNLYMHLCKSITYDNGLKKFWLDRATGGDCYMISARGLRIIWGNSPQYWEWKTCPGSMFPEVAYLRTVCWFDVAGTFQQLLRPGRYMVSYRMQLRSAEAWRGSPIKLCIQNKSYAHPPHQSQVFFDTLSFNIRSCPLPIATSQVPASLDNESFVHPWGSGASGMQHPSGGMNQVGEGEPSRPFRRFGAFMTRSLGLVRRARPAEPQHSSYRPLQSVSSPMDFNLGESEKNTCVLPGGVQHPVEGDNVIGDNEDSDEANNVESGNDAKHTCSSRGQPVWVECDVGEFFVEDDNEGRPIEVHFSMKEVEVLWWKGGFTLDGVIIRPSYLVNSESK
eukprot:c1095_g1_i1 orf=110-1387(+)